MEKRWLIPVSFVLFLWAGCSDKDDTPPLEEEPPSIYHQHYVIDDICLQDTTLLYDFTGNTLDDFWLKLEWDISFEEYNYWIDVSYRYVFNSSLGGYSDYNTEEERPWAEGDKVIRSMGSPGWTVESSGGSYFGTNNEEGFYQALDSVQNIDSYWAFYLQIEEKEHFGWLRMRCHMIEEFALNLTPWKAILVGQRE